MSDFDIGQRNGEDVSRLVWLSCIACGDMPLLSINSSAGAWLSRPLRIALEDGWYHVINRGIERRSIFRSAADYRHFVELLAGCLSGSAFSFTAMR
jgi:hypothetical protein